MKKNDYIEGQMVSPAPHSAFFCMVDTQHNNSWRENRQDIIVIQFPLKPWKRYVFSCVCARVRFGVIRATPHAASPRGHVQ